MNREGPLSTIENGLELTEMKGAEPLFAMDIVKVRVHKEEGAESIERSVNVAMPRTATT
jgi:hypothetical protein